MSALSSYSGALGVNSVDKKLEGRWSSPDLASQLLPDFVSALATDFSGLETPVKLRAMLAFLALSERKLEPVLPELLQILDTADAERDEWVPVVSGLVREWLDLRRKETANGDGVDDEIEKKRKKMGRMAQEAAKEILFMAEARSSGGDGGDGGSLPKVVETPYFFPMELPYLSKRLQPRPELYRNRHFYAKNDEFGDEIGGDDWDFHSVTTAGGAPSRPTPSQPAAVSVAALNAPNGSTAAATAAAAGAAAAAPQQPASMPAPPKLAQHEVSVAPPRRTAKGVPLLPGSTGLVEKQRVLGSSSGGGSSGSRGIGVGQRPRAAVAGMGSRAGAGRLKMVDVEEAKHLEAAHRAAPGAKGAFSAGRGSGFFGPRKRRTGEPLFPLGTRAPVAAPAANSAAILGPSAVAATALLADAAAVTASSAQALSNWEVPASSVIAAPGMGAPPAAAVGHAAAELPVDVRIREAVGEHLASLSAADVASIEEFSRLVEPVPGGAKKRIKLDDRYRVEEDGSRSKETLYLNLHFEDRTWSKTRKVKRNVGEDGAAAAPAAGEGASGAGD